VNSLKTILYFSIFDYPLHKDEIISYCNSSDDVESELKSLLEQKIIYLKNGYYNIENSSLQIDRRLTGNLKAQQLLPKAYKMSKRIMSFPFVESVNISGALSKNFIDDDGDIDFFIITAPNKLWIARTLLIAYKKIVLFNSKKYFCVNYFISTNHLEIDEQNKFTATELVTLIPVYGEKAYTNFVTKNKWVETIFPNKPMESQPRFKDFKKPLVSNFFEQIFNIPVIGESFESFFKNLTLKKWESKFRKMNPKDFQVALKSTDDISKHHPRNFQKRVITLLNSKYNHVNTTYNLNLEKEDV
jgi:hypothetical protein